MYVDPNDEVLARIIQPYSGKRILRTSGHTYSVVEGEDTVLAENLTLEEATAMFKEQRRVTDPEFKGKK